MWFMAALLKLDQPAIEEIVAETVAQCGELLLVANYNTPGQLVISGAKAAVALACQKAKERKGRGLELKVSGAFHSPMMAEANRELAPLLRKAVWSKPRFPVYCNAHGKAVTDGESARDSLLVQMTSSVLWIDTMAAWGIKPGANQAGAQAGAQTGAQNGAQAAKPAPAKTGPQFDYVYQVAAFKSDEDADKLRTRLEGKGLHTRTQKSGKLVLVLVNMLVRQLRELEDDGLVSRKVYGTVPPRVDYSLTPLGVSLVPIMESLKAWGSMYENSRGRAAAAASAAPAEK